MTDREREPGHGAVAPEQAAALLGRAQAVTERVAARRDVRREAAIEAWTAAGMFCYGAAFLLLFWIQPAHTAGGRFLYLLLIPLLIGSQLERGARDRFAIVFRQNGAVPVLCAALCGAVLFVAGVGAIAGLHYTVWQSLVIAAVAAAPLAVLATRSSIRARGSAVPPRGAVRRDPLSPTAQTMTVALGIYLGVIAAVAPYSWGIVATLFLMFVLFGVSVGKTAQWGLVSVASEWHRRHWIAFGIAAAALLLLAVVAMRTPWNTPLVGAAAAIVIALPLALTALIQRRWNAQHRPRVRRR